MRLTILGGGGFRVPLIHRALLADLQGVTDARLFEPITDPRNRATGTGVTRYVLLHGLAQHHAYHAGQIAILSKF